MANISWPPYLPDTNPFNHMWDTIGLFPPSSTDVKTTTFQKTDALEFTYNGTTYDILGYPATSESTYLVKGQPIINQTGDSGIYDKAGQKNFGYQNHTSYQAQILTGIETVAAQLAQQMTNQWQSQLQHIINS